MEYLICRSGEERSVEDSVVCPSAFLVCCEFNGLYVSMRVTARDRRRRGRVFLSSARGHASSPDRERVLRVCAHLHAHAHGRDRANILVRGHALSLVLSCRMASLCQFSCS